MPGWRMPPCSARRMVGDPGRNCPACAVSRGISGSPAPAEWACTPSCWTKQTPSAFISPSRRLAPSAPTMAVRPGRPINHGLLSPYELPDPTAEVGHCVHNIAMHPSRPDVLFMQKHWDVMRSEDAGDSWHEVSGNLPTDFGFPIAVHAHEPETIYVVPIKSDSEHFLPDGKLRVYRSRSGGNDWEALTNGLPQTNCYVNVLRGRHGGGYARYRAASISAPPAARCMSRPIRATTGRPSSTTCPACFRWKCRPCHDPGRSALSSAQPGRNSTARCRSRSRESPPSAAALDALEAPTRCCAAPSATSHARSGDLSSATSPAGWTSPTSRWIFPCQRPW